MNLLELNYDVLEAIVSLLSTSDALSLSATTRGLYAIAIRQAVTAVTLTGERQCVEFFNFVQAYPARISGMRSMEVIDYMFWRSPSLAEPSVPSYAAGLARVLENATNLSRLRLSIFEQLLSSDAGRIFGNTLAGLPHLMDVELRGVGALGLDMLSRLRDGPRRLSICAFRRSTSTWPVSISLHNILLSLVSLQSIQELHLAGSAIDHHIALSESCILGQQWPAVRTLGISFTSDVVPLVVHAFPNVRTLRLRSVHEHLGAKDTVIYQARWGGLDRLSWQNVYSGMCQLTGPVYWLEFDLGFSGDSNVVFATLRPIVLSVTLTCKFSTERLVREISTVKFLEMLVTMTEGGRWISGEVSQLTALPLVAIQLCVQDAKSLDPASWAMTLAQHLPSVVFISVRLVIKSNCRIVGDALWWQATGAGVTRMIKPISSTVGDRIQTYMHDPACDFSRLMQENVDIHELVPSEHDSTGFRQDWEYLYI